MQNVPEKSSLGKKETIPRGVSNVHGMVMRWSENDPDHIRVFLRLKMYVRVKD